MTTSDQACRRPRALPLAEGRSALRRLSRRGMGRAGIRRPRALREADARRLPGRPVLDHHPAQARQFPEAPSTVSTPEKIARYTPKKVERLMQDAGIVRNRAEDRGHACCRRAPGSTSWRRAPASRSCCGISSTASRRSTISARIKQVPAETPLSRAISKELAGRGFKFVGPTIVYAFMQAVGMVNDHLVTCHRHAACTKLGRSETRLRERQQRPERADRAPGSACCRGAGSICSTPPRSTSRSRTSRTGSRGSRAGTARPWARNLLGGAALPAGRDHRAPARRGSTAAGRLAVLLHDAPEYVIGDMISPFKAVIGDNYKAVEARLLAAIHIRFGLPAAPSAELRRADQGRRPGAPPISRRRGSRASPARRRGDSSASRRSSPPRR